MWLIPSGKDSYSIVPDDLVENFPNSLELTEQQFSDLINHKKCFNQSLTALVDYYETQEEVEQRHQDYLNNLRAIRSNLLSAFDKYKTNVYYGIEQEDTTFHEQILSWYHLILDLNEEAINNPPEKISYYL